MEHNKIFEITEIFYILILVVATQCESVKNHLNVHLKLQNFTVFKLYHKYFKTGKHFAIVLHPQFNSNFKMKTMLLQKLA